MFEDTDRIYAVHLKISWEMLNCNYVISNITFLLLFLGETTVYFVEYNKT